MEQWICMIFSILILTNSFSKMALPNKTNAQVKGTSLWFLSIPITAIAVDPDLLWFYVGCIITVLMGNVFRWAYMYSRNELTWKSAIVQFCISIPICYMGFQMWNHYKWDYPIQGILFVLSIFSVFIAGVVDTLGKISIMAYAERMFNILRAAKKIDNE